MKLLYSRNPNPRLAVAAARQIQAPVTFEFAAPLAPGQAERYRPLNPALRLPILVATTAAACGRPMPSPARSSAQQARPSGGRAPRRRR